MKLFFAILTGIIIGGGAGLGAVLLPLGSFSRFCISKSTASGLMASVD